MAVDYCPYCEQEGDTDEFTMCDGCCQDGCGKCMPNGVCCGCERRDNEATAADALERRLHELDQEDDVWRS